MRIQARAFGERWRLALAVLSVLGLLLAVASDTTQAAEPVKVAGPGNGAGRVEGPVGVAVDESGGQLYVADSQNWRIDKFGAAGNFLLAWGWGVADQQPEAERCGPEVGHPKCFDNTVASAQANLATAPGSVAPAAVAVDPSGDVYVAESSRRRISKFTPTGEFLWMAGKNVNLSGTTQVEMDICTALDAAEGDECGAGQNGAGAGEFFTSPSALDTDSSGDAWVLDGARVVELGPEGAYLSQAAIPGGVSPTGLALDSSAEALYTIKPGVKEEQKLELSGMTNNVSKFKLGNLPPSCASTNTTSITYTTGLIALEGRIRTALSEVCGAGIEPLIFTTDVVEVKFGGPFESQNVGQLTCTVTTAPGTCTPSTLQDGAGPVVLKLHPEGTPVTALSETGTLDATGKPQALGLDAADNLYVGDSTTPYRIKRYNPAGELKSQFATGQLIGSPEANALAIDEARGALFSASSRSEANSAVQRFALPPEGPLIEDESTTDLLPTTVTLQAKLNPEGHPTTYKFLWGEGSSFDHESVEHSLPGSAFAGEAAIPAELEGLLPETEYGFRLQATNSNGTAEGEAVFFTTPPAVKVDAQWASDVSAADATLRAELDPLGVPAKWWLEYGTGASLGSHTAPEDLGEGIGDVEVAQTLTGLSAATAYSYRFAAKDERDGVPYVVHGPTQTFTTPVTALGFQLPDERAWEQVTPLHKGLGRVAARPSGVTQAAEGGSALTYTTLNPVGEDAEGNRTLDPLSSLARRGAGGWSSQELSPPEETASPVALGSEFRLLSADLCRAAVEPYGQRAKRPTLLSAWASERTPYLRENCGASPTWTPLVVGCPAAPEPCPPLVEAHANVPPGTEFGGEAEEQLYVFRMPVRLNGANPNLSDVVVRSSVPLTGDSEGVLGGLYEWSQAGGSLELVSRLPAGEGGKAREGMLGWNEGLGAEALLGAVSANGRYVYWSDEQNTPTALYVRDTVAGETVRLDSVQPGVVGTGADAPRFMGASADGSTAFFTDTRELTADSGASKGKRDLYACELVREGGEDHCELSDLTPESGGEAADVQGIVSGIGEAGEDVYFVANGALVPGASAGDCTAPPSPEATCNLYLAQLEGGEWSLRFVAELSNLDGPDWGVGLVSGEGEAYLVAGASPDGRYLAFMSRRPLSGYDNRDAASGEADEEVFRYDAQADRTECVSCNPAGGRPRGARGRAEGQFPPTDPHGIWTGSWLAGALPYTSYTQGAAEGPIHQPRRVLNDGRTYFNAFDSLVPADSNGTSDAYQYEPHGTGSCSASSGGAATAQALGGGGCVSLLSSGTSERESSLLDVSASGNDAFVFTDSPLSVLDEDPDYDIYDARVGGSAASRELHPECLGEACQPAARAPDDQTPASAAFQGPGNVPPQGAGCGAAGRKASKLSRRAKKLRRHARQARHSGKAPLARKRNHKAARLAKRARRQSAAAKRCRRAARRAGK